MNLQHRAEFDPVMALRCKRALVTFLGDIGLWRKRVVLVGGLVPRYLVGSVPLGVSPHVGTTDVDLVIRLAVEQDFETYKTLATNLRDSGFAPDRDSYQWSRLVDGAKVILEFLCDTDQVEAGKIHTTRHQTGSGFRAVNIPGAQLAARDFAKFEVEAERLDGGGMSKVTIQVAGILPFVVLKIRAFQERHYDKDSYDLYIRFSTTPTEDLSPLVVRRPPARQGVTSEYSRLSTYSANGSSMSPRTDRTPMPTSWTPTTRTAGHGFVTKQSRPSACSSPTPGLGMSASPQEARRWSRTY